MKFFILYFPILMMILNSCNIIHDYNYPDTHKDNIIDEYFGTKVNDPFRWLEQEDNDKLNRWIDAQNKTTNNFLSSIPFRKNIKNRLNELWYYQRSSAPFRMGKYFFQYKNNGKQNHDVLYIKDNLTEKGRIILNPNSLSEDGTASCPKISVSNNSKYLAHSVSISGSDWNEIRIIDIGTGKEIADRIQRVKFSEISWYKNGFFYSGYGLSKNNSLTEENSHQKVFYHKINTPQEDDILVYENKSEPGMIFETHITSNEKYLVLSFSKTTSGNGIMYKNLKVKDSKFKTIFPYNEFDYFFEGDNKETLLFRTNDNAPNYKLIEINPEKENMEIKDIIGEKENVLEMCKLSSKYIAAIYLKDAYSLVRIYTKNGIYSYDFELPGMGTVTQLHTSYDSDIVYYSYTSFTIPEVSFSYNLADKKTHIISKPKLKFKPSKYITEQVFYKSKDGTSIPMFITRKKSVKLDGKNPCLLYGYGGFNISLTPTFSPRNILWLESGGIYAVPNLRGGGEYGSKWHKAGTKMQKQNVFDDFITAAEFLTKNNYTNIKKLAIHGGSNGGLLIAAVTNQRPDLFRVAIPSVGVMDMLRYHKFTIGYAWSNDYGTSEESKEMFEYLLKYSPIHNVNTHTSYPAILVTTADHDDRVVPAHSFKYISALQQKNTNNLPAFIRIDKNTGHGAGMPISKQIDLYTDIWTFTFKNMKLNYYENK